MVKDLPTKAAEDTGSGELAGKFENYHQQWCVLSQLIYTVHIYSQMEYEYDFLENFIRFYCTTLYFFPCNHVMP